MKPAPFEYHAPIALEEAVATLARYGDESKALAGGQSLVPILALRLTRFEALVDLGRIPELRGVSRSNGTLAIGAMTTQTAALRDPEVARSAPLLAQALPLVGHFQIRNRGTVGGSVAHADPAAEIPAVALALDAELEVLGPDGARTIAAKDFFVSTFVTALDSADILTEVRFPVWGDGSGFAVEEVSRRHGDFAMTGAACGVQLAGGKVTRAAIAMFGMGSTPIRATAAEAALVGGGPDTDVTEVGRLAVEGLTPPADVHASSDYRVRVGAVVVERALRRALAAATG